MKHDDHLDPSSGGPESTMPCERVLDLVPTFVDGEASESLAGAVRKHVIDCADCRVALQEEASLRQWFEPIAGEAGRSDIVVPEGFAARVTAMAFGEATSVGAGAVAADLGAPGHSAASRSESQGRRGLRLLRPVEPSGSVDRGTSHERNSLGFLIGLTGAAAALMVTFTLMLAQDKRLDVGDAPLSADAPLEETLRELEAQNEAELKALDDQGARAGILDEAAPADERQSDTDAEAVPRDDER